MSSYHNGSGYHYLEVFVGNFVHSTREYPMIIMTETALGIEGAKIKFIEPSNKLDQLKEQYGFGDNNIIHMKPSQFMVPGFIDTHIHAPQFPNNGLKLNLPLLEWLQTYTFPAEYKLQNVQFAKKLYPKVVDRLISNGTTTASYFASLHLPATKVLADTVHEKGQRALIGKVSMLINCPENYREESLEQSLQENEELIQYIRKLRTRLVHPIITPRFAPTCPTEQLKELADLAKKHDCHIQSHLSETRPETAWVKELFPWSTSYTDVYDKSGLLNNKTIMAHCIWMEDTDINRLKECGVGVSHCPNSNISIRSGLCDVRRLLNHGVKVGLGTDCSGGYSPSLLDSMRQAVQTSNVLAIQHMGYEHLSMAEVFRLATLGGARVVGMDDIIGNFETEKEFDALLIDMEVSDSPVDIMQSDKLEDKIYKFLFNGDDRNIIEVYIAGRKVHDRNEKKIII